MSRRLFTSDLHLGHRFVAGLRGFDDTDLHDEHVARRWRETVGPRDTVWVLGDLAMSSPDRALEIIGQLPGTKHLVAGNHDAAFAGSARAAGTQRRYLEVFDSVHSAATIKLAGRRVLLSHFPYPTDDGHADRGERRCDQFRLPDLGAWLLHGHTHMADQRRHGRQIHVGLDAWDLAPVAEAQISDLIAGVEA